MTASRQPGHLYFSRIEKLATVSVLNRFATLVGLARLASSLLLLGLGTTLLKGVAILLLAIALALTVTLALSLVLTLTGTGLLLAIAGIRLSSVTVTSTSVRLSRAVTTSGGTTAGRSTLRDGHVGGSAAEVTLSSKNLVVVGTELHAVLLPSIKVSTDIDATSGSVVLANGPVLLKGLSTINGGSVGTGLGEDVVGAAIDLDSSLLLSSGGGIIITELLNDVVLDQRVSGPSVDGEVAVAVGLVLSLVRDGSSLSRAPTLSTDDVATSLPRHGVRAARAVLVGSLSTTIRPPRVVETIVSTGAVGGTASLGELGEKAFGRGCGDRTSYERQPSEDGSNANHFSGRELIPESSRKEKNV
jgi:hypothetical protein